MGEKVRPRMLRIEETRETRKLYALEEKRSELIQECAREWARVVPPMLERHLGRDVGKVGFWEQAVPQALFDVLESFERNSSALAATAYLEHYGYRVTRAEPRREEPAERVTISQLEGNCDGSGLYAYDARAADGRGQPLVRPCIGCRACR